MLKLQFTLLLLSSFPMWAQHAEFYALAGYSRASNVPGWDINDRFSGGTYGAGAGVHLVSVAGAAAEFTQERVGGFADGSSYVYTGFSLNLALEKRTGAIRPYALAGLGGGSFGLTDPVVHYTALGGQFAGGVAFRVSGPFFLRPQVRYVHRTQFDIFGGSRSLPSPISFCVAFGLHI